jgi:GAF domain-containing protein
VDHAHDPHPMSERGLGLGGATLDDEALTTMLQQVVVLARHTIGTAHSVSITVADGGGFRTSHSTEEAALAIDQAQYEGGTGPCLEAVRSGRQVQAVLGGGGGRWPLVDRAANGFGVTGVLSTPLVPREGNAIGALNIYGGAGDTFTGDDLRTAGMFGEHASVLMVSAMALKGATQDNEQLRQALASREIIGEAKGILMQRQGCTRDEAFDILRRASQRENRKLRDLAEELVMRVEARKQGGV